MCIRHQWTKFYTGNLTRLWSKNSAIEIQLTLLCIVHLSCAVFPHFFYPYSSCVYAYQTFNGWLILASHLLAFHFIQASFVIIRAQYAVNAVSHGSHWCGSQLYNKQSKSGKLQHESNELFAGYVRCNLYVDYLKYYQRGSAGTGVRTTCILYWKGQNWPPSVWYRIWHAWLC